MEEKNTILPAKFNHIASSIENFRITLRKVYCYRFLMYMSKDVYQNNSNEDIELSYTFSELRECLGLSESKITLKDSIDILVKMLNEFGEGIPIKTKTYMSNGEEVYDYFVERLISKHKKVGDNFYITVTPLCVSLINGIGGYTNIDRKYLNSLESAGQSYMYLLLRSYLAKGERTFTRIELLTAMNVLDKKSYQPVNAKSGKKNSQYMLNIRRSLLGIDTKGNYLVSPITKKEYGLIYSLNIKTDIAVSVEIKKNVDKDYSFIFKIKEKKIVEIPSPDNMDKFNNFVQSIKDDGKELHNMYIQYAKFDKIVEGKAYIHFPTDIARNLRKDILSFNVISYFFSQTFPNTDFVIVSDKKSQSLEEEKSLNDENEYKIKWDKDCKDMLKVFFNGYEKEFFKYIDPLKFYSYDEQKNIMTLKIPSLGFKEELENKYLRILQITIRKVYPEMKQLMYHL